jgi:hypothetical protein
MELAALATASDGRTRGTDQKRASARQTTSEGSPSECNLSSRRDRIHLHTVRAVPELSSLSTSAYR